jgi:hypothetical protein
MPEMGISRVFELGIQIPSCLPFAYDFASVKILPITVIDQLSEI